MECIWLSGQSARVKISKSFIPCQLLFAYLSALDQNLKRNYLKYSECEWNENGEKRNRLTCLVVVVAAVILLRLILSILCFPFCDWPFENPKASNNIIKLHIYSRTLSLNSELSLRYIMTTTKTFCLSNCKQIS